MGDFSAIEFNYSTRQYAGRITLYVIVCAILAASGGLMFGYDVGISSGVTAMDDFLIKFFPDVHRRKHTVKEDNYCKYDSQTLQLFTSSLYIAAAISSFLASQSCTKLGRRLTMQFASLLFLVGVVLTAAALNLVMLIAGRMLLGLGIGFANQAIPLFLSEIAPISIRGSLNILFQLNVTIGILIANVINYFTANFQPCGWRLSLGIAGVPAVILCIGSFVITETPTSLIERHRLDEALDVLKLIRGSDEVGPEFQDIVHACETARHVKHPFRALAKRRSRPQLVIAIAMQIFQQFTGINAIMFYAPVLFQTIGFKNNASLLSAVIIGTINVLSTVISIFLVDRVGRKVLLIEACGQMLLSQAAIGVILEVYLKANNSLNQGVALTVLILVCVFVSSFAWSWGPLGWLIPSETFPIETRTAGFAFAVCSNMLFTFLIGQAFLSMLCHMRFGIFFFFAAWIIIMGMFTIFLLPETKGLSIDEMVERVWKKHWYWSRYIDDENYELNDDFESGSSR